MDEICGDIGGGHNLSKREKISYLLTNFSRGITSWSFPGNVRGWKGSVRANGTDSPGRIYVDAYLKETLPQLMLPGKVRVLDIGCGTGYLQTVLSELGYTGEYVGLDVVREEGFDTHTDAFTVSFVESKIEDYTSSEPFDLVFSNTALEHIEDDSRAATIAGSLLAKDGVGIHLVPSYWSLFLYLFHGYRQYTPRMLRRVFRGQQPTLTGLGGLGSFIVHVFGITLPERVFGATGFRDTRLYRRLVTWGLFVDRILPLCRAITAVVVRPRAGSHIKVMFALPSLLVGGIEQQLTEHLRRYDRSRFSLAVVTLFEYEGRESFKDKLPPDVTLQTIGMQGATDWRGWMRLIRFIRAWKPSVVVSSMFSANTAMRLLKPFFPYASIAREHNLYDEKKWWQKLLDRLLSHVTCRIIAVSRSVAEFASKQAGIDPQKFTVIQNGVDLERLQGWHASHQEKDVLKRELGFASDEKIIVTVGRLKKAKNHEALLKGFATFSKDYPLYRLVIIGTGVEQPALQELIRSIPHERAVLLERFGDTVWPYYAAADWFILPSLREGFPNVMLEAMAFGLPLLGTQISGTNECIEEGINGFFIPYTASGITGSLRRIAKLGAAEHTAMSSASLQHVKQFSIEQTVHTYEQCFISCHTAD